MVKVHLGFLTKVLVKCVDGNDEALGGDTD